MAADGGDPPTNATALASGFAGGRRARRRAATASRSGTSTRTAATISQQRERPARSIRSAERSPAEHAPALIPRSSQPSRRRPRSSDAVAVTGIASAVVASGPASGPVVLAVASLGHGPPRRPAARRSASNGPAPRQAAPKPQRVRTSASGSDRVSSGEERVAELPPGQQPRPNLRRAIGCGRPRPGRPGSRSGAAAGRSGRGVARPSRARTRRQAGPPGPRRGGALRCEVGERPDAPSPARSGSVASAPASDRARPEIARASRGPPANRMFDGFTSRWTQPGPVERRKRIRDRDEDRHELAGRHRAVRSPSRSASEPPGHSSITTNGSRPGGIARVDVEATATRLGVGDRGHGPGLAIESPGAGRDRWRGSAAGP